MRARRGGAARSRIVRVKIAEWQRRAAAMRKADIFFLIETWRGRGADIDRKRIIKFFLNGFHSARDRGIFNRAGMRPRVKRFARKKKF